MEALVSYPGKGGTVDATATASCSMQPDVAADSTGGEVDG